MDPSENKIVREIRLWLKENHIKDFTDKYQSYDFWFIYDGRGKAESWQGGFDLGTEKQFENQYSLIKGKKLVQNWK